ncbi:MAG: Uma2 family endonuclease [Nannocystaceae bacterium]
MATPASSLVEPAEYLVQERAADVRSELWRGEVFAMVGASWGHNLVTSNLLAALHAALRGTRCRAVSSDLKVHVPRTRGFVYPDVVVVCDPPRFHDDHRDVVVNPVLVAEVLSDSTERFDRGDKSAGYRSVPSIREIVLLSQTEPRVEHYERMEDDSWRLRTFESDETLELRPLGCSVSLATIYDGVLASADQR